MRQILLAAVCVVAAHSGPVLAQTDTAAIAGRPLVFVNDVKASSKELEQDANALTTALCGALARDKRVEVLCAPDVRQIMSFAAMGAMTGSASPALDALQARMAKTAFIVSGSVTATEKGAFALVISTGTPMEGSDPMGPVFEKALVRLEEVGVGKSTRLLDRLPDMASRLIKAMMPSRTMAPAEPPAPLK